MVGKTDFDLPGGKENAGIFRANDLEVIQTGKLSITEETPLVDGKPAIVLSQKLPLKNKKGEIAGIIGISVYLIDIEAAFVKEDAEMLFAFAHKLKGASTYAGA